MHGEAPALEEVRLNVFGELRLQIPDRGAVELRSRRARALIAYLLLARGRTAPRERLAGLLWSDRGEEQARASLRQCLLELRNALKPAGVDLLQTGRERIALRDGVRAGDLQALEAAIADREPQLLTEALEMIGSEPLLDGLTLGGLFGEWLGQARANLEERLVQASHTGLDRLEAAGDWTGVRALASAFLKRHPLDEMAVAAAMRADVALGSSASAHRRFRVLKEALARDLGVEPGAAARSALTGARVGTPFPGVGEGAPGPAAAPREARPARPLVIIAEFDAPDLDAADAVIVRSIREEVVSGVARFRDLCVVTDPTALAPAAVDGWAEQGASYVLGASLRPALAGRRLAVQLLRIDARRVIWSEVLDLPDDGLAVAVDCMIARVVGAVLPSIDTDLTQRPATDVYARYIAAREAAAQAQDLPAAKRAAAALQALVDEAPDFVQPYLPLARLYNTDFGYTQATSSGPEELARAFELAKAALRIDRGHVHGYTVAGWCYLRQREWRVAKTLFDQALALNPFHADRVMEAGFGHIFLGELERARALLDRCLLLNPLPKDMFFMDLGLLELLAGDHDRAASHFELVARPTIWDDIYTAINAALRGRDLPRRAEKARARIAAIWPPGRRFDVDDILAWIDSHHPFGPAELQARFLDGARRMLEA